MAFQVGRFLRRQPRLISCWSGAKSPYNDFFSSSLYDDFGVLLQLEGEMICVKLHHNMQTSHFGQWSRCFSPFSHFGVLLQGEMICVKLHHNMQTSHFGQWSRCFSPFSPNHNFGNSSVQFYSPGRVRSISSVATAFRPVKTDVWRYSENNVLPQGFHLFCTRTLVYKLQRRARREIWRARAPYLYRRVSCNSATVAKDICCTPTKSHLCTQRRAGGW